MGRLIGACASAGGAAVAVVAILAHDAIAAAAARSADADAGASDATTDAPPVRVMPCTMTFSGGLNGQVGCSVTRDYASRMRNDAAVAFHGVRIETASAVASEPNAVASFRLFVPPSMGPQPWMFHHTDVRVEEGALLTRDGGAHVVWLASAGRQSVTLTITSMQIVQVAGGPFYEIHGEIDGRLPVENVPPAYAPPDVRVHITF